MLTLLALFGPKQGLRIPLRERLVIGRGNTADLQLVDGKVSREHCSIETMQAGVCVRDLGSQNGTFVNGTAIVEPTFVNEGDEIVVGDTLLAVAAEDADVCNARYGEGTLLLAGPASAPTAARTAASSSPLVTSAGVRELGELAARLATSTGEEEAVTSILDVVEAALHPRRATLFLRARPHDDRPGRERILPLATRGKEALASVSRTLLALAASSEHGILVEDAVRSHQLRDARSVAEQGLRSVMVVRWGTPSKPPHGFLQVEREAEHPFSSADLTWLGSLGQVATLGLAQPRPIPAVTDARLPVGESQPFVAALALAQAAARVDSTVVLLGETGSGKEELARFIHANSRRASGPFVAVNCGAIAESLAQSELLGHEKGAFTGAGTTRLGAFESAEGGTILLDEIGDLAPSLQVILLRTLQERAVVRLGASRPRPIDVRVIAATHRDLREQVQAGRFREDLFFRLSVLSIRVPPLRERQEDLPLLARSLLGRIAARLGRRVPELAGSAQEALGSWDYPGNVRELANVLERMLVLRDPFDLAPVDGDDVRAALAHGLRPELGDPSARTEANLADAVARTERASIEAALRRARGVKSHAARLLGISRPTLDKRIADLGIDIWAKASGV
jgi:DNA-binding NtrC family response regulator/pSer/pThr/pTyr-binding forkhead associated (FHA) protein